MEFVNFCASDSDDSNRENESEKQLSADDQDFIDDTEIDQNPSDYYGLTNVTRSFSHARNDAQSDDEIERYESQEAEERNYAPFDDYLQEDVLAGS